MIVSVRNILINNQKVKEIIINECKDSIVINTDENNLLGLIRTFLKNKEHVLLSMNKNNVYKEGIAPYFNQTAEFLFINHVLKNQIHFSFSPVFESGPIGPEFFAQIASELATQVQKLKA